MCNHSIFSELALLLSFSQVMVKGLELQGLDTPADGGVVCVRVLVRGPVLSLGGWERAGPGAFPGRSVKVLRKMYTTPGKF